MFKKRNAWFLKSTQKFRIEIPKTVEEEKYLYYNNSNTCWYDAISKEMKNVKTAFKILDNSERVKIGYHQVNIHMVFFVKM